MPVSADGPEAIRMTMDSDPEADGNVVLATMTEAELVTETKAGTISIITATEASFTVIHGLLIYSVDPVVVAGIGMVADPVAEPSSWSLMELVIS